MDLEDVKNLFALLFTLYKFVKEWRKEKRPKAKSKPQKLKAKKRRKKK